MSELSNDFIIKNRWRELGDVSQIDISGPLYDGVFDDQTNKLPLPLLETMYNPEYFGFVCEHFFGIKLLPYQLSIIAEVWIRRFPMLVACRGGGKTFLLALYAMLRAFLYQGTRIVICGSGFRQAKFVFDYMETIWNRAHILRDVCGAGKKQKDVGLKRETDKWTLYIGDSTIVGVPLGDGTKIRGLRANTIIADEYASITREIYDVVIRGFASVQTNPIANVQRIAENEAKKELNLYDPTMDEPEGYNVNQSIISGTPSYQFNHFYEDWDIYRKIILSKGDESKLFEVFPGGIRKGFNWRDYSIIRLPYDVIPEGFMDTTQIARTEASVHKSHYLMEYCAVFPRDSDGYFRRSLIDSCIASEHNIQSWLTPPAGVSTFSASLKGSSQYSYIYGVDTASERDNFILSILEIRPTHRRLVYCWSINKHRHRELLKKKAINETEYFSFCGKKIREMMKLFPCECIAIDTQGGGWAIIETLHDLDKIDQEAGEKPLWPIIDENKKQDTDDYAGEHIIEPINFASAEWVSKANVGLKRDLEDKVLLFPEFDCALVGLAFEEDNKLKREHDTLEDCIFEIEETKNEMTTIVHTQTAAQGRDHWDTPEIKLPGGKKGRQRKDRYSALLMANASARRIYRKIEPDREMVVGGFSNSLYKTKIEKEDKLYSDTTPAWYRQGMEELFGV